MRILFCAVVASSLFACTAGRVRSEASPTLKCSAHRVSVEEKEPGKWLATGCGRAAICELPEVADAEPQCAGGAPLLAKH
jgi:hypothetical protein